MPQIIGNYNITSPITEGMPDLQVDSGPGVGRLAGAMAIDVTGGVASQALGAALAPYTLGISYPVISFIGGMSSNYLAQKAMGDDFSLGQMIGSGALNIIPGAGKLAATATGRLAIPQLSRFARTEAIRSGGIAAGERTIQTAIDEGRFPTFDEYLTSASLGAGFGAVVGTGIGIAAQKGLIDKVTNLIPEEEIIRKISNKTPRQIDKEISENPKFREDFQNNMNDLFGKVGTPADGPIGRANIISRDIRSNIDRTELKFAIYKDDEALNSFYDDLAKAPNSKEAEFTIDRFINEVSEEKDPDISKRLIDEKLGKVIIVRPSMNSLGKAADITAFRSRFDPDAKAFKRDMNNAYKKASGSYSQRVKSQTSDMTEDSVRSYQAFRAAEFAISYPKTTAKKGIKGAVSRLGEKFIRFARPSTSIPVEIVRLLEEQGLKLRKYDGIAARSSESVDKALKNVRLSVLERESLVDDINNFILNDTNNINPKFFSEVKDDLIEWRDAVEELQYDLIGLLGPKSAFQIDDELYRQLKEVIQSSIVKRNYATKTYRFYEDATFVPNEGKLRDEALNEEILRLTEKNINEKLPNGEMKYKTKKEASDAAIDQATNEMTRRLQYSANRMNKADQRAKRVGDSNEMNFQAEGILAGRVDYGPKMKEFLGEVQDPAETMRQTLAKTARLTNALKTDEKLIQIFSDKKIQQALNMQPMDGGRPRVGNEPILTQTSFGRTAAENANIRVPPEINEGLQDIFYSDSGVLLNNAVGKFVLDNMSALTGLTKISKTLFNPASYAPNLIGNFASVAASGINPFKDMKRGFGLAFSEFGGFRKAVYGKGEARSAFNKDKNRFEELGLGSGNVLTSELRRAGKGGLLGNTVQAIAAPFSKLYNVGDVTMRYVSWRGTQRQLVKAIPELGNPENKAQLEEAAARMVNATFQNYDKVPELLKKLSQIGVANPFINFTAELMRNMYNQGRFAIKMMRSPDEFMKEIGLSNIKLNKQAEMGLRNLGLKRAAALTAVVGGGGAMIDVVTSNASQLAGFGNFKDLNENEKRAFNETVAKSWHRGKRMVILMNEDGKTGKYFDSEYLIPQTMLYSSLRAGLDEQRLEVLPKLLADNFLGEGGFLLQAAPALLSGKDQNGREISVEPGIANRLVDNLQEFIKIAFEPGVVRELDRWNNTIRGQENALEMGALAGRLLGFRFEEFDLERDAARRMAPQSTALNNAKALLGTSRKYDIKEQYDRKYVELNKDREGVLKQLTKHYENLKILGLDDKQALGVLDETALSTNDKFETVTGYYSPMPYDEPITKTDLYESLGSTPEDRLNAIRDMSGKVNPAEIRSLVSLHKRMVRKSLTPEQNLPLGLSIIKKMDPQDRIRRLTDPNGPFRLTQSNKPLISELIRLGVLSRSMIPYLPTGQ
tara:strand:+ start:2116 stop:6339 length:4224 start_codon:yes stop_codon:yes gene_type:complete